MSADQFDKASGASAPAPSSADIKTKQKLDAMRQDRAKEHPAPPVPNPFAEQIAKLRTEAARERDQQIKAHTQAFKHASNKLRTDMKLASTQGRLRAAFKKDREHER